MHELMVKRVTDINTDSGFGSAMKLDIGHGYILGPDDTKGLGGRISHPILYVPSVGLCMAISGKRAIDIPPRCVRLSDQNLDLGKCSVPDLGLG